MGNFVTPLYFNKKVEEELGAAQARIMKNQKKQLNQIFRGPSINAMKEFLAITENAGRSPEDAYREFDPTSVMDKVPAGEHATLSRLMQKGKSVNIGREAFDYRKVSDQEVGQSSMSGQVGVDSDKSAYKYAGTPIPIHTKGYGERYRVMLSAKAEGYDIMTDYARESERKLLTTIDNYLWDGNANLVAPGGQVWTGIKNDSTVATATLGVDLSSAAATATDIRDEVRRVRDILYITNNCAKPLRVGISREIASNWERIFSNADGAFGTIADMIKKLRGVAEIYEDSRLTGNQMVMFWDDQSGFHPVIGMPVSSYAVQRLQPFDDFNFIKMAAVGFLSKNDYEDRKCALYAS